MSLLLLSLKACRDMAALGIFDCGSIRWRLQHQHFSYKESVRNYTAVTAALIHDKCSSRSPGLTNRRDCSFCPIRRKQNEHNARRRDNKHTWASLTEEATHHIKHLLPRQTTTLKQWVQHWCVWVCVSSTGRVLIGSPTVATKTIPLATLIIESLLTK